ncbi:dedicator of cytokinesis protein 7 [Microplitis demolitor]|uniref:dedicator of cytokinesis protein 7 n=1 Tax=Microplitis demolitor TaxID=69319 RepID=UPI0004CD1EEE|nr:dedicator of cytokinesis protein 7 [Microplitis demolitor]
MSSVHRTFAYKLSKQLAADVRRHISNSSSYSRELSKSESNASGFSSSISLCEVYEPVDYEDFLNQHLLIIERDPLRSILDFPPDDVELRVVKRKIRTEKPVVPFESLDTVTPYVRRCIETFTSDYIVIHRKYRRKASPIARERLILDTPRQDFEVDQEDILYNSPNDEDDLSNSLDTPRGSWASLDLRHSQHDPLLPGLLDRVSPETIDQINQQKRSEDRQDAIFPLYTPSNCQDDEWQESSPALEPSELFSHKILIKCLQLKLELEVEPIFASFALYDAKEKRKLSENFYVDMNPENLKRMLGSHIAYSDASTLARSCVFSISKPSPDLFIVVRLEKVLQGDISECAEPYLRDDKNRDKVKVAAAVACERLGRYRMPFAWTAIHLSAVIGGGNGGGIDSDSNGSAGSLDRKSGSLEHWRKRVEQPTRRGSLERKSSDKRRSWSPDDFANCLDSFRPITLTVSSFFKHESERLRDEDLYKFLIELRRPGSNLKRLKCIPGILKLDLSPKPEELPRCLDPDLRRLIPYPDEKNRPIKEILEFACDVATPDLTYRNFLYIYPKEVNFSSRTGSARNITVRIQLMGGEQEADALTAIFGRSSCPEMTHECFTSVSYHNKNPNFYDEIKIRLPADLSARHHLLFTFYHISCQKKVEQPNVETPIAYTWLPLLRDGHLQYGEFTLPAMLDPPPSNYSYIAPDVLLPGTRWVDAHRGVFNVIIEPVSSVHPQDKFIYRFLSLCGYLETGQVPPRIGEAGMEAELKSSLLELSRASNSALVRSLPQLFDQLISYLVVPPTLPSCPINIAAALFEAIGLLARNITNLPDGQVDVHGRHTLLATYAAYQCSLPRMTSSPRVARSRSNPDLSVEDLEMEIHARGLDRTASMRQESPLINCPLIRRLLHEELALHWVVSTGQARELAIIHSWFFFELMVRSMVIHLYEVGNLDAPRKIRFSPQYCDDISTLVDVLTNEVINRYVKDLKTAYNLIFSLANFLSDLLSIMDRGFVLSLVRTTCCLLSDATIHVPDSTTLFSLKMDFIRTVCSHEHFVALNLPFGTGYTSGSAPASPSPSTSSSTGSLISTLVPGNCARFAELSQEFRQQHFLVGLILLDLSTTLEIPNPVLQNKAIGSVRYLMSCHDKDPRYADPSSKARVAVIYLPLLNIIMDSLPQLYQWDSKNKNLYPNDTNSITQSVALAIAGGNAADVASLYCRVSLSSEATRHLLMCFLWVLKGLERSVLIQWCSELNSRRVLCLLQVLNICIAAFEYKGKKALKRMPQQVAASGDIRSRLEDVILGQGSARSEMMLRRKERIIGDKLRWRKDQMSYRANEPAEERVVEQDAHIEGALAAEASLIVLDTLEVIVQADCAGGAVNGVLKVLLKALARNQSTSVLQHMFNSQRALVVKYHSAFFDDGSERCGNLCLTLLTRCSSPLSAIRSHAAASLYLLMRQNFEVGNNFARVKMQMTTSLSTLVGRGRGPSEGALRRALKTVLVYAERDTELANTSFPEQVKDLLFNLHMILSDTVKMKEFQEDPEMLLDLMYRIAKGYQSSPDLRLTWLANMAQQHMERKNHTEAAMCLVHSAALVAEYLHLLEPGSGGRPIGAVALSSVSTNVLEESAVGDDVLARREEGLCLGPDFSESGLAGLLEHAASSFFAAGMYEAIPHVYRVLLPIAETAYDYKKLANIHGKLHEAYTRIDQLSGKRVFGTYFRVGFYGSKFGDLDGEEFVYKEPTLTKLPEIFSRLENFYIERFSVDNVVIIKDSNPVDVSKLDPDKAYVQITYVEPYFEAYELRHRPTVFHRNFNIKRFIYATPFTTSGKAHGELKEQCKRKTILTVATYFPYLKTRIRVVARKQIVLSPIEVAIEDIQKKTVELATATNQDPPDPKILQMVLQGCIGTTVNQGPAEVANVFLSNIRESNVHPSRFQHKLRLCFKDFTKKCFDALRKNKNLIGPDQRDYQRELERNYQRLTEKLAPLITWSGSPPMNQECPSLTSLLW